MSELLESVKRLAEYQERTGAKLTLNYITLAKHLARLERDERRVAEAARQWRKPMETPASLYREEGAQQ